MKIARLAEEFPHAERGFAGLYFGSQLLPRDFKALIRIARATGRPTFVNQNGVAFPAWYRGDPELVNAPMRVALQRADVVIYQSEFCRQSAAMFLGATDAHELVLHNPVDTAVFQPGAFQESSQKTLLLGGTQSVFARIETAVMTLRCLHDDGRTDFDLRITGDLSRCVDEPAADSRTRRLLRRTGLEGHVKLTGPYERDEAPAIFTSSYLLLHTAANDPCPNIVLEAMACGLPVVHPTNGGTPELVGPAGVAVPAESRFDVYPGGDPGDYAGAVLIVEQQRATLGALGRERAVNLFDMELWLSRHGDLLEQWRR